MYITDRASRDDIRLATEHDCLRVPGYMEEDGDTYQVISYCLTEWLLEPTMEESNLTRMLAFSALSKENISSEQLYRWSAPMDVVEQYQRYLDYLATSNEPSAMAEQMFYNCTLPRFGPRCQYALDIAALDQLSLNELVYSFYRQRYDPKTLTCYMHLQCNRSTPSMCLDWTEVCDQIVDCQGGVDERLCVQIDLNSCEDHQYQCYNGQCVDNVFWHDGGKSFECLDRSDERAFADPHWNQFSVKAHAEPTMYKEDTLCSRRLTIHNGLSTSSCQPNRGRMYEAFLLSDPSDSASDTCWSAVFCELRNVQKLDAGCRTLCPTGTCLGVINASCAEMFRVPRTGVIVLGHIFFIYTKEDMLRRKLWTPAPRYICYDDQLCDGLLENKSTISFENATCRYPIDMPLDFVSSALARGNWYAMYIAPLYKLLPRCNRISRNYSATCSQSTAYRCRNSSECIARYQFCDGIRDCLHGEDEECAPVNGHCLLFGIKDLFKCPNMNTCIPSFHVGDGFCRCGWDEYNLCEDEYPDERYIKQHISFPRICDGFTELIPVTMDGRNETDETECQYWRCNNTYTRCDGFWNCFDGADEVDCAPSSYINCSNHDHVCISPDANQFICLPLHKANNGEIDCLGGIDEPKLCRSTDYKQSYHNFYCLVSDSEPCVAFDMLCEGAHCYDVAHELVCYDGANMSYTGRLCKEEYANLWSPIEEYFCARHPDPSKSLIVNFALKGRISFYAQSTNEKKHTSIAYFPSKQATTHQYAQLCHRGLVLHTWLDNNTNSPTTKCLCPPSYYGDRCQYQNQRVSVTMRLQTFSDSRRTVFALTVILIDDTDERLVHSYQQINYLYVQHCRTKFNIYLLYSSRPKNLTQNYSIHIDIYEKNSLSFRGSVLVPIHNAFLPVNRIAVQVQIPRIRDGLKSCSTMQCVHGQCVKYSNDREDMGSFCQCYQGWTGKYCTIPYTCTCSLDAKCLGISATNRSICVCPLGKWGPQCLLRSTICQSDQNSTCEHGGRCIPMDEHVIFGKQFVCLCPKGFTGDRCQTAPSEIGVSFHKDIPMPQSVLTHFIRVIDNGPPEHGSTYGGMSADRKTITIRWSRPFHIVFAETFKNTYYLVSVQETYQPSATIIANVNPSHRCAHLSEVLNETIVDVHLLRRIKHYHRPCQRRSPAVSCFYDIDYFCLCQDFGQQRVANCFEFDPSTEHNCSGQSDCENGGRCLQDNATCPQTSACLCPECFYGTRCQFSSSGFDLSLDAILGYHIRPHITVTRQSALVQTSVALSILIGILGLVNSIISLLTFTNAEVLQAGCGWYLSGSSIATLLVTVAFTLKFFILLVAHVTYVTNRAFLTIQCRSVDFLFKVGLHSNVWLNACVAAERAFAVIRGTQFDKKSSKRTAKYVILVVSLLIACTTIHDPIHRRLLVEENDDVDEHRIWCIAGYSPTLRVFDSLILMLHFFVPFTVNIVSALVIIITTARQRTAAHRNRTYQNVLKEQFLQQKHLLIAPLIMIGLALPRLIISFVGGCMKSISDPWLYLIGYLISLTPTTVTFLVFVLPSKFYLQIFRKTLEHHRRKITNAITFRP